MRDPPQRLGRGLAALLGEVRAGSSEPTGEIALEALEPSQFQPRTAVHPDKLADLVASIQAQGILQSLLVRPHPAKPERYQIIAGERRWRAAQQAGLSSAPCLIRSMSDADATAAALIENLQRVDLNPIEEAEGFRRLLDDFGLTHEELGSAIGRSRSHVANAVRLLGLPSSVAELVRSGKLTAGHARAALACHDPAAAAIVIVTRGLSVRDAEALSAQSPRTSSAKRPKPPAHPDLQAIEADLAERLGMQVTITPRADGGTLKVSYRNLDQLDHLIMRLGRL